MMPIPVVLGSEVYVYGLLIAGILGSNSATGTEFCPFCLLCVV